MNVIREAVSELVDIFRTSASKHEANARSTPVMEQISRRPEFIGAMLDRYLRTPGSLDRGNYPVVGIEVDLNPWFGLSANCWIPLPDRNTNLSTKAIHHHGNLLLTTATLFGPGYEHWTFTTPVEIEADRGLYRMELIESAAHPQHHVAFVDANIPHTPFYPPDLSITLALFSSRFPTTWRDRAKRLPGIRGREDMLRNAVRRLGLGTALDIKVVDSFDFFPTDDGFEVMRERKEFRLGPNADHVASVFHVIQRTGNEGLAQVVRERLGQGAIGAGREAVEALLPDLERGRGIEARLSSDHYDKRYANFTREDIHSALAATRKGANGRKFTSPPADQEAARAAAD
jgi:hypothetical protein